MTNKLEQWELEEQEHARQFHQTFRNQQSKTSKLLSTTFRYQTKDVATIAQFMVEQGERPVNLSQVLRYALEMFEGLVVKDFPQLKVSSESQGVQVLESLGINTATTKINKRRQINNMSLESYIQNSPQADQERYAPKQSKDFYVDPAILAEAERRMNGPQVSIPENAGELIEADQEKYTTEYGLNGLPISKSKPASIPIKKRLLSEDGTSKEVSKNKKGYKEIFIICQVCNSHSPVLLKFNPKDDFIDSDTCPVCDGITPHQIPVGDLSKQFELSPMNVPINEFRKQMLNPGGAPPKEGGNEDD